MSGFAPKSDADVVALIRAYPLATVVSRDFRATPLPLLPEVDADGRLTGLIGHFAARNPQVASVAADPHVLILFNGPNGYVSPEHVPHRDWGPTWNYAIARVQAELTLDAGDNDAAVDRLVAAVERGRAQPWSATELGPRYDQLIRRVVAFRARVLSVDATFKLGQDESAETFASIVDKHPDRVLTGWMQEQRGG